MKAMFHAISFFLVCVTAYYIALVMQKKEELSLERHSESSHSSQENSRPTPAPEEPPHHEEPPHQGEPPHQEETPQQEEPPHQEEPQQEQPLQNEHKAPEHDADEHDEEVEVPTAEEEVEPQPNSLARGWGEDIDWVLTYEEGLMQAKTRQKPLMVIHHLEDCPRCKDLKAAFSSHEEIQRMAKDDFIMFNLMHETNDPNLAPDGYYVPRIIFVDPAMVIRNDIMGNGEKYKYSYSDNYLHILLENMKKAKIRLNMSTP